MSSSGSSERTSSGISAANAPSGIAAELAVPWAQYVSSPACSAALTTSRASRDRPMPAAPLMTTPMQAGSARAAAICSSSRSRPTNGHPRLAGETVVEDPVDTPLGVYGRVPGRPLAGAS